MNDAVVDRRLLHLSKALLMLFGVGLTAVAAALVFDNSSNLEQINLIRDLSAIRIDGQRFFAAPAGFDDVRYRKIVSDAEGLASSPGVAPRIKALIEVARERLSPAASILSAEIKRDPENAELLNDLGVVYWGLGETNPSNYFLALDCFERSAQLAPHAGAPLFNLARGFRKLSLQKDAESALQKYGRVEHNDVWLHELSIEGTTEAELIRALRNSLDSEDIVQATNLLDRHPEPYRAMALESALNPGDAKTIDRAAEFALDYFAREQGEPTMRAILAPLSTRSRDRVLRARHLVQQGVSAYFRSNWQESLDFYDRAQSELQNSDSIFDGLWIKLKRADSLLRSNAGDVSARKARFETAERLLEEVIARSRPLKLNFILGQALAAKAVASAPTRSQDEVLPILNESNEVLSAAGVPREAARPLYYIALIHALAADPETSVAIAYRSLRATSQDDSVHLAQLYRLLSSQVYRMGYPRYALPLAQKSLDEALNSKNPGLVAVVIPYIATIHASYGNFETAEMYLRQAQRQRDQLVRSEGHDSIDLELNLLCSQIKIGTGRITEAEECLTRNLQILKSQVRPAPDLYSQTLMQLAEINLASGRENEARGYLQEATRVIEENDAYFATAALRMPFENQRRSLYDVAIGFEYGHDGRDSAWGYVQRYRSKLFLEFLRQMNPGVAGILDKAVDRSKVQQLIPDDIQTLEYVLLKDRLLIWLVSRDKFVSVSVHISRKELEEKVSGFIERITAKGDVQALSEELYKLLVLPIESHLDPKRSLAIIPDQALHRLSFAALWSPELKNFLLERFPIVESPNLTTLLSGGSEPPARGPAISFGAQTDDTGATRELNQLQNFYTGIKTFNRKDALKPEFLSAMEHASVFHFAGHSQDAADPLRSSILLDGEVEGRNSVTAVEISRHRMPENSVVILASCDSSVGNSRDGIGMRGLTSAFLISGAGSVVGSLWPVEAKSTTQLVVDFHKKFATNHSPVANALRDAQLAFIKSGKHPYYWSGFVVTGNTTAFR